MHEKNTNTQIKENWKPQYGISNFFCYSNEASISLANVRPSNTALPIVFGPV